MGERPKLKHTTPGPWLWHADLSSSEREEGAIPKSEMLIPSDHDGERSILLASGCSTCRTRGWRCPILPGAGDMALISWAPMFWKAALDIAFPPTRAVRKNAIRELRTDVHRVVMLAQEQQARIDSYRREACDV